jgi:hypothetical protein
MKGDTPRERETMNGLAVKEEVRERPILFSGSMVKAILEGRKTQTRRVVNPQPITEIIGYRYEQSDPLGLPWRGILLDGSTTCGRVCPYGKVGDRLWVRETHHLVTKYLGKDLSREKRQYVVLKDGAQMYQDAHYYPGSGNYAPGAFDGLIWRPSIYMPRWASRITLETTEVRVQRLQEISGNDAREEGVWSPEDTMPRSSSYRIKEFADGWNVINGKRKGCSWADNPWVWAITFKVIKPAMC